MTESVSNVEMNIEKVSAISVEDVARYLRISEIDDEDKKDLNKFLKISKSFIKSYTGVKDLDIYEDFVIVVFVLCQDMNDSRSYYVDGKNLNDVVKTILDLHSVNLL